MIHLRPIVGVRSALVVSGPIRPPRKVGPGLSRGGSSPSPGPGQPVGYPLVAVINRYFERGFVKGARGAHIGFGTPVEKQLDQIRIIGEGGHMK